MIVDVSDPDQVLGRKSRGAQVDGEKIRYVGDCSLLGHRGDSDSRRVVVTSSKVYLSKPVSHAPVELGLLPWDSVISLVDVVSIEEGLAAHPIISGLFPLVAIHHRCAVETKQQWKIVGCGNQIEVLRLTTFQPMWSLAHVLTRSMCDSAIRAALGGFLICDRSDISQYVSLERSFLEVAHSENRYASRGELASDILDLGMFNWEVKRAFWKSEEIYPQILTDIDECVETLHRHHRETRRVWSPRPAPKIQREWPFAMELLQKISPPYMRPAPPERPAPIPWKMASESAGYLDILIQLLTSMLFDGESICERENMFHRHRPYDFKRLLKKILTAVKVARQVPSDNTVFYHLKQSAVDFMWEVHQATLLYPEAQKAMDVLLVKWRIRLTRNQGLIHTIIQSLTQETPTASAHAYRAKNFLSYYLALSPLCGERVQECVGADIKYFVKSQSHGVFLSLGDSGTF